MSDQENSDSSVTWEDFFGTSTDLMPTLLGMYDALEQKIGITNSPPTIKQQLIKQQHQQHQQLIEDRNLKYHCDNVNKKCDKIQNNIKISPNVQRILSHLCDNNNTQQLTTNWQRPISMSSISSSSSSTISSTTTSTTRKWSSNRNDCDDNTSNAYLASVESLEDCDNDDEDSDYVGSDSVHKSKIFKKGLESNKIKDLRNTSSLSQSPRSPNLVTQLSAVERVLLEIIDTEAVYVADLQQVIEGYLNYWNTNSYQPPFANKIADLFSNIKEIYDFNKQFLSELEECGLNPVLISQTFVRNNVGFEIYCKYCTNYPQTMSILTELMSQDVTAKIFRDQQFKLGHSLPLGSYLLKPVQRILKYHLLLQSLVKQCDFDDIGVVDLALETMTGIAKHINEMKRKHEDAIRVQEIQSLLYGWNGEDLTTFGELCAEGTFRMHGAKAKRQAFLFEKMLLLTKNKEDGILSYKTHIMCSNLMLIESVQGDPLSFHVIPFDNPRSQCTLRAPNMEQKREWTLQLKRVILENYNAVIPLHARQLVMELGQTQKSSDEITTPTTKRQQYSAPEYLQRRKCDRRKSDTTTSIRERLRRSRNKSDITNETSRDQSRDRIKFPSWRRKSEPNTTEFFEIPQYNTQTIPQKISKLKKQKQTNQSTFYTELHISESCDEIKEIKNEPELPVKVENETKEETVEDIVSQLLMQNREFQRILKKHKTRTNRNKLKNDSSDDEDDNKKLSETKIENIYNELQPKKPVEEEHIYDVPAVHPEYKIYRCTPTIVRNRSLLQRFKSILNEDDEKTKSIYFEQGSSSLGARIAFNDYADPQQFPEQSLINKSSIRPDSLLSSGSSSASETSFYEQHFDEKIDEFRDSAIYSGDEQTVEQQPPQQPTPTILQRLELLNKQNNRFNSNVVLNNKLNNSNHLLNNRDVKTNEQIVVKGWVKHVVNQFQ